MTVLKNSDSLCLSFLFCFNLIFEGGSLSSKLLLLGNCFSFQIATPKHDNNKQNNNLGKSFTKILFQFTILLLLKFRKVSIIW